MGNTPSCFCNSNSVRIGNLKKRVKDEKGAMLLDTSGNIREIKLPAKTGELMIEEIGHVITLVDELRRTGRVWALGADEELVAGEVYMLVPASRVHSKASEFEMAVAKKQCCQGKRTKGNNMDQVSRLRVRERERVRQNKVSVFPASVRSGNQLRWNPVLDPISESFSYF